MRINLDRSIFQQKQLSGLPQANPNVFTQAAKSTVEFGNSLQRIGQAGSRMALAQKAVADNLGFNELKQDFELRQKEDAASLEKRKADPSLLIKSDSVGGPPVSALTKIAVSNSFSNEDRLTRTNKFKNLSEGHQQRLISYMRNQHKVLEAATKLETTRLLVDTSKTKDTEMLAGIMDQGSKLDYPEVLFEHDITNYKAHLREQQVRGIYQPEQVEALIKQVDKKVATLKFDKDRANALISADPKELMKVDAKLLNGDYGISGEKIHDTRITVFRDFNAAQNSKAAQSDKEAREQAGIIEQDLEKMIREQEVSREVMTARVDQASRGALRGRTAMTRKLYKAIEDLDKPDKESPNSPNQIVKNEITGIDLTDPDAREQLEIMRAVVDGMKNSELDTFSIKQATARTEQIREALKGLDDKDQKEFNQQKKIYKDLIQTKTKSGGPLAGFVGNEQGLQIFALEYYEDLLGRGIAPKDAWGNIKEIVEQAAVGSKVVNVEELTEQLGSEAVDQIYKKIEAGQVLTEREQDILDLLDDAGTANKTPLTNKQIGQ